MFGLEKMNGQARFEVFERSPAGIEKLGVQFVK